MNTTFVSYNCAQRELAKKICGYLAPTHVFQRILIDLEKSPNRPSGNFEETITMSDYIILVITSEYKNSKTCQQEAQFAVLRQMPILLVKVFPELGEYSPAEGWPFTTQITFLTPNRPFEEECHKMLQTIIRQCDLPLRSLTTIISQRQLTKIDMPALDFEYFDIHDETQLLLKLHDLRGRPEKGGLLLVHGCGGTGKTSLVVHTLQYNDTFLMELCEFDAILWLNCFKWKDDVSVSTFSAHLSELFRNGKLKEKDFRNGQLLLVLDDIYNASIIEAVFRSRPGLTCIAITREAEEPTNVVLSRPIESVHLKQVEPSVLLELFDSGYHLGAKLNYDQLHQLAVMCCGLPLAASVIAAHFRNKIKMDDGRKISSSDYLALTTFLKDNENPVSKIVNFTLEREDSAFCRTFYAFLLFEPDEDVRVDDLAVLWQCSSSHQALVRCQQFLRKSLIQVGSGDGDQGEMDKFKMHHLMYDAVVKNALFVKKFARNVSELRWKIVIGYCHFFAQKATIQIKIAIVAAALAKERWELVKKIFSTLEIPEIVELCNKKSDQLTKNKFLLHFIYNLPVSEVKSPILMFRNKAYQLLELILQRLVFEQNVDVAGILALPDNCQYSLLMQIFDEEEFSASYLDRLKILKVLERVPGLYISYLKLTWKKQLEEINQSSPVFATHLGADNELSDEVSALLPQGFKYISHSMFGETPLMAVSAIGNLKAVKELTSQLSQSDIFRKNNRGWTAFTFAAICGHLEVVQFLHQREPGLVLTQDSKTGWTPCMLACWRGHTDVVKFICGIDQEAPKTVAEKLVSPLMIAAKFGHLDLVQFLYDKSEWHLDSSGWSPLMAACQTGQLNVVKFIIQKDMSKLFEVEMKCNTSFFIAAEYGWQDIVQFFLENDTENHLIAMRNSEDQTALMLAARNGHINIVRQIFAVDPDYIKATDSSGRNALAYAVLNGHRDVVKQLHEWNKHLTSSENVESMTPLMEVARDGFVDMAALICDLIGNDKIDRANSLGVTALMVAAGAGHLAVVELLCGRTRNAGVGLRDNRGMTPLLFAIENNHLTTAMFLAEKLPSVLKWQKNDGRNAFMVAASKGYCDMAAMLLELEPTLINLQGSFGETALTLAASSNQVEMLQFLLNRSPPLINVIDRFGINALMVAAVSGHSATARLLSTFQEHAIGYPMFLLNKYAKKRFSLSPEHIDTVLVVLASLATVHVLTFERRDCCAFVVSQGIWQLLDSILELLHSISLENLKVLTEEMAERFQGMESYAVGIASNVLDQSSGVLFEDDHLPETIESFLSKVVFCFEPSKRDVTRYFAACVAASILADPGRGSLCSGEVQGKLENFVQKAWDSKSLSNQLNLWKRKLLDRHAHFISNASGESGVINFGLLSLLLLVENDTDYYRSLIEQNEVILTMLTNQRNLSKDQKITIEISKQIFDKINVNKIDE